LRRPLVIGLVIAAVAGGGALAIALSGGDDGTKQGRSATTTQASSATQTVNSETETTTRTTPRAPKQDAKAMDQAVTTFVRAVELSDSARACGQVLGGAGKQLPGCAEAVGIDPRTLPSSDELDISRYVLTSGSTGQVALSSGSIFSLKKSGGSWLISGFRR
jgi:hypothetical protein